MTASIAWATFHSSVKRQVAKQMAAPAETRTPNLHRAKRFAPRECEWKHGDSGYSAEEKPLCLRKTTKNALDSDRPSHGRRLHKLAPYVRPFRQLPPRPSRTLRSDVAIPFGPTRGTKNYALDFAVANKNDATVAAPEPRRSRSLLALRSKLAIITKW